jgi:acetyltransferase-like isoleucine patch superfamily enzyme
LNNDVIVTPGWAEKLAGYLNLQRVKVEKTAIDDGMAYNLYEVPDGYAFSIIAPVTNYCAGLQKVMLPVYNTIDGLNKEAGMLAEECRGEIEEVKFVIGFCMAFKKSLFDEIGPFDESLWPCSGEEIDFCLRALEFGHRVGIAHDVYVHHEGSKTFNEMEKAGQVKYDEICKRNDAHLAKKWGADFWDRQAINAPEKQESVTYGKYSYVDGTLDVTFVDEAKLTIGNFCSIAKDCKVILGGNHRNDWISTFPFPAVFPGSPEIPDYRVSKGDVIIGNDVWIGAGVTILSGVTIGDGAIIGAGSVISKDVAPYSVVCGNPARHKKFRFENATIARLLEIAWWDWTDDKIREAIPILMSGDIEKLFSLVDGKVAA